ncbi:hypothetical protein DSUL_20426 [Desulfovibrionales bacterium]
MMTTYIIVTVVFVGPFILTVLVCMSYLLGFFSVLSWFLDGWVVAAHR